MQLLQLRNALRVRLRCSWSTLPWPGALHHSCFWPSSKAQARLWHLRRPASSGHMLGPVSLSGRDWKVALLSSGAQSRLLVLQRVIACNICSS